MQDTFTPHRAPTGVIIGAITFGILLAGALFASPYITLWQMRADLQRQDLPAITERIDFPSVREGLKQQASAYIEAKSGEYGAGPIGSWLGSRLMAPLVDAAVTPEGVVILLTRQARTPDSVDAAEAPAPATPDPQPDLRYLDYGHFQVAYPNGFAITLTRSNGFVWRITAVRLPSPGMDTVAP